jgi:hypothetical protein
MEPLEFLRLSVLREYLEQELKPPKLINLPFDYDFGIFFFIKYII